MGNIIPNEFYVLINLLYDTVKDDNTTVYNSDTDFNLLFDIAKKHSVAATVFNKIDKNIFPKEVYGEWYKAYAYAIRKTMLFNCERAKILEIFEANGIEYCVLKGPIMQTMYKSVREFADNDILVKKESMEKVCTLLKNDGYEHEKGSNHDAFFKNNVYNFEIHQALFDEQFFDNNLFNPFCEENRKGKCEFVLSNEEFFVFNVAHFSKHYGLGGSGLRSFTDLYLLLKNMYEKEDFDQNYVNKRFAELEILDFFNKVKDLTCKFFNKSFEKIDIKDLIYIYKSGTYGSKGNHKDNCQKTMIKKGKAYFIIHRISPPYSDLINRYPVLKKMPILVPFCWLARIVSFLFDKEEKQRTKRMLSGKED